MSFEDFLKILKKKNNTLLLSIIFYDKNFNEIIDKKCNKVIH